MLEAFALLAARVHLRIDDDFPQITEALLNILYPHYLRPVPSMSVAQFHTDAEQGKLTSALKIPKGTVLYSRPVEGVPCKFRTSYDTTVVALQDFAGTVDDARPHSPGAARVGSGCSARRTGMLPRCFVSKSFDLDTLAFYLNGESAVVHGLYELLCRNCCRILVRDPANPKTPVRELPVRNLQPMGFGENGRRSALSPPFVCWIPAASGVLRVS